MGHRERRHPLHPLVPAADRADRREARRASSSPTATAAASSASPARSSSRASPTPPASRPAACAPPSRPAATPPGTRPAPPSSCEARNGAPCASRPSSSATTARRSTRRRRSCAPCEALSHAGAAACCSCFGNDAGIARRHHPRLRAGVLPDRPRRSTALRPDLMTCGRTLFGATPAQGPAAGGPLLRLHPEPRAGVHARGRAASSTGSASRSRPATTRWPRASSRSRPIFEEVNLAADHNMLLMDVMRRWPPRHDFACCCTRSRSPASTAAASTTTGRMATDTGRQPARPADETPHENLQFLVVPGGRHPGGPQARRPAARQHRQRRQRPPPRRQRGAAGDHLDLPRRQLTDILDEIEKGTCRSAPRKGGVSSTSASASLPAAAPDNTDRNRTSPFAFTGNKFEFRAVGSQPGSPGP